MFKPPKLEESQKREGSIEYPHVTMRQVLREFWKLTTGYRALGTAIFIGVTLATLCQSVISPVFYKKFFDVLAVNSTLPVFPVREIIIVLLAILGLNLFGWMMMRGAMFAMSYFEARMMGKIRQYAYDHTLGHSYSFFINNFTGSLVQRINRFMRAFEKLFDRLIMDVMPLLLKVGGALAVLAFLSPVMAWGMLIWILIFAGTTYMLTRFKLKYDRSAAELDSKVSGIMSDSFSNHTSIQLFASHDVEFERFRKVNTKQADIVLFRWNLQSGMEAFQTLLSIAIEFFVFYFLITHWSEGWVTIGTFALVQAYIMTIEGGMWSFSRVIRDIYECMADAKEMVEILHLEREIKDVRMAKDISIEKGKIEFKNIGFKFGKVGSPGKSVFDGLTFTIKPGEKVALIGTSGAGKSTLVKLLLRLYDIQSGEILVDGQNIKEVTQDSLRENISLVPQEPVLFHRSLMENIRYGKKDATDAEVIEAAKLAHCDIFINEFPQKYQTYVGERGVKLSGGERQRVAIARAILKNAPILVLDEATSSLDSHSESLIQDALHTLMKGKTTIVIAHRLSTIRNMDRIIVVSRGGVVEEGSHDELIKKDSGVYAKLWSLQAGGFANKSIEELLEV